MYKNKHIVTALIVAPLLAVISYFAVDYFVSEQPHQAKAGGQYKLVPLPNCRYASGQCEMKNGSFSVVITGEADSNNGLRLNLQSEFLLDAVYVSVVNDPTELKDPISMTLSVDAKTWVVNLTSTNPIKQYLRVAVTANKAIYYAETKMLFLNYETSFHKDFRNN